jgi:flavorubredoxin
VITTLAPPLHLPPLEVAPETFLLRAAQPMVGAPLAIPTNSLLIRGREPVVIDTGVRLDRDRWFDDLTDLVGLDDVRWIVLSSDGIRHRGNLIELLERCPRAVLLTSWAAAERLAAGSAFPPHRVRWLEAEVTVDVGGRSLRMARPPVYDGPAARTVFDTSTGVLWSSDLFATPMPPRTVDRVDELPPAMWAEGLGVLHHHALAPWLPLVDRGAYAVQVGRLRQLTPSVIVGAHTPVIPDACVEEAFAHLARLPDVVPPPHPAVPTARTTSAPRDPGPAPPDHRPNQEGHP